VFRVLEVDDDLAVARWLARLLGRSVEPVQAARRDTTLS